MSQYCKKFGIPAHGLSILHNYFELGLEKNQKIGFFKFKSDFLNLN